MSSKTKITLSKMTGGNLWAGDSREADILLNGTSIGELEIQANYLVSEGTLSYSANRYQASDLFITIYPAEFGVEGFQGELNHLGEFVDYITHQIEIVGTWGARLMTAAEAKREAKEWVADTVKGLLAGQPA